MEYIHPEVWRTFARLHHEGSYKKSVKFLREQGFMPDMSHMRRTWQTKDSEEEFFEPYVYVKEHIHRKKELPKLLQDTPILNDAHQLITAFDSPDWEDLATWPEELRDPIKDQFICDMAQRQWSHTFRTKGKMAWLERGNWFWQILRCHGAAFVVHGGLHNHGVRCKEDEWKWVATAFFHVYGKKALEFFLLIARPCVRAWRVEPPYYLLSAIINFGLEYFGFVTTRCDDYSGCGCRRLRENFWVLEEGEPKYPEKAWPWERVGTFAIKQMQKEDEILYEPTENTPAVENPAPAKRQKRAES